MSGEDERVRHETGRRRHGVRIRNALVLVLVGLVLLASGLVRYVATRDMQREEPAALRRALPAVVGLLAGGAALVACGAGLAARGSPPALMVLAGVLLLGAAGLLYLLAGDARWREQAVLDRRWVEVHRRAAGHLPRVLPAGRPPPAPLRGMPLVFGLLTGGVVLCIGGPAMLLLRPSPARSSASEIPGRG